MKSFRSITIITILLFTLAACPILSYGSELPNVLPAEETETVMSQEVSDPLSDELSLADELTIAESEATEEPLQETEVFFEDYGTEEDIAEEISLSEQVFNPEEEMLLLSENDTTEAEGNKTQTTVELKKNGFSKAVAPKLKNVKAGVRISWKKVRQADGYRVYRRNKGQTKWNGLKNVTQLTFFDKTAKSGKTYEYLVLPYKMVKKEKKYAGFDDSSIARKMFLSTPSVNKTASKDGGLYLNWKKIKGAKEYRVYRRAKTSGSWYVVGDTNKTSFTDVTVKQGKRYYYTVAALNGSDRSCYAVYKKVGIYLPAPKLKKAKASGFGTKISWKKLKGASGYRVYRKKGKGAWKLIGTSDATSFTDRNYKAGTKYTYTVRAYNKNCKNCFSEFNEKGVSAKAKKLKVSYKKNGTTYMYLDGYLGISRADLLAQLKKHEKDSYYLKTPARGGDNRSAYGDPNHTYGGSDRYGVPGFNCTGFVWRALYDSGANGRKIPLMEGCGNCWQNPRNPGRNSWYSFLKGDAGTMPVHYRFSSVAALLKSGKAEKGDIIYCLQNGTPSPKSGIADSHVGIFYGDTPSDNKFFHCGPTTMYGAHAECCISGINPGSPSTICLVKWLPGR